MALSAALVDSMPPLVLAILILTRFILLKAASVTFARSVKLIALFQPENLNLVKICVTYLRKT